MSETYISFQYVEWFSSVIFMSSIVYFLKLNEIVEMAID